MGKNHPITSSHLLCKKEARLSYTRRYASFYFGHINLKGTSYQTIRLVGTATKDECISTLLSLTFLPVISGRSFLIRDNTLHNGMVLPVVKMSRKKAQNAMSKAKISEFWVVFLDTVGFSC